LLNDNLKADDVRKIDKFAMQLGDLDQTSLVEDFLLDINLNEFFQAMQLLDDQKNLKELYR